MNIKSTIEQLEELKVHCEGCAKQDPELKGCWYYDVKALNIAIEKLKGECK